MHIPDGFIAPHMYVPLYLAAGGLWAYGLRRTRRALSEQSLPYLAMLAALAFVLGMIALPLPGGTSAHPTGIAPLAVLFGVWMSFTAFSVVLFLQAALFGDGGITTLPLNALAMGLCGSAVAWLTFHGLRRWHETTALALAGWLAVVLPALLIALALGAQPWIAQREDGTPLFFPFGFSITLPAVLLPHLLIGIAEAALTVFLYRHGKRHLEALAW